MNRQRDQPLQIGSVVIDCFAHDLAPLAAFWQAALGYGVGTHEADWIRLDDPQGRTNLSFQVVPDPTPGKNKLHLDLYTVDQTGEVDRLLGLGATLYRRPEPGEDFVVLTDPAGNQFCVIDKRP